MVLARKELNVTTTLYCSMTQGVTLGVKEFKVGTTFHESTFAKRMTSVNDQSSGLPSRMIPYSEPFATSLRDNTDCPSNS